MKIGALTVVSRGFLAGVGMNSSLSTAEFGCFTSKDVGISRGDPCSRSDRVGSSSGSRIIVVTNA